MAHSRIPVTLIKTVVAFGLIALLISKIDTGRMIGIISNADYVLLAGSFLIFVARTVLAAARCDILVRHTGHHLGIIALTRYYFIGFFFNMFLPTVIGGDIARGWYLYKESRDERIVGSIVVERVFGLLALIILSTLSVITASRIGMGELDGRVGTAVLSFFGVGVTGTLVLLYPGTASLLERILPKTVGNKLKAPITVMKSIGGYTSSPGMLAAVLGLSILYQFSSIAATLMIARSLGDDTPFLLFLILLPIVWLASMIPASLNGLGIREGAFVVLFGTAGMAEETAMAVSLVYFSEIVGLSLLGGLAFLIEGGGLASIRSFDPSRSDSTVSNGGKD